ncbi:hypothetical protein LTR56_003551 [Elasticomyces elasticus]|nr:hypothetical protein LTR22_024547 [Elasticomyces elasticus]KAK3655544.1 hypothetical protein LTR56_003551 [Elasticomyces elasticus]KAK4917434.1 hypothetical protein LTR49_014654 [Elasticomyces elasticus]KAK5738087.1 hypothetical protein LTS12_025716 [Elasticomyces elasticus]
MAASPSLPPRLPSPPPIPEDQLTPSSPGLAAFDDLSNGPPPTSTASTRRIRPGTKSEDMSEGPPLIPLQDIDSPFPLTEHLRALHAHHTHPAHLPNTTTPITPSIAALLVQPPDGTSKEIWLYELARFLIQKTNAVIIALFADSPPCSPQTCVEMRASEWQYLCAVHDPPKSCAAIDYCCHTLDWAATTLTSSKMFPSRLGLGGGVGGAGAGGQDKVLQHQLREITNIFRRVYRIYAHAWFQHREMFWRVEGKLGIYGLFKRVCDEYGLIQGENYTIPREAEGLAEEAKSEVKEVPKILARPTGGEEKAVGNEVLAAGDTTKRHRHTTSDHVKSVTPVIQEEAEEEDAVATEDTTAALPREMETESEAVADNVDVDVEDEDGVKPLQRQATELRTFAESLPQPGDGTGTSSDGHVDEEGRQGEGEEEKKDLSALEFDSEEKEEDVELKDEVSDDGSDDEPAPDDEPEIEASGVRRSDTVKPPRSPSPAEKAEVEEDEQGVGGEGGQRDEGEGGEGIGGKSDEAGVEEVEAQKEDEVAEVSEPVQEPAAAAKPEEAGKSVGD